MVLYLSSLKWHFLVGLKQQALADVSVLAKQVEVDACLCARTLLLPCVHSYLVLAHCEKGLRFLNLMPFD